MQQDLFDLPPAHPPACAGGHRPAAYRVPIYRVALVREASLKMNRQCLRSSQDAADLLRQFLGAADREYFVAVLLDRVVSLDSVYGFQTA